MMIKLKNVQIIDDPEEYKKEVHLKEEKYKDLQIKTKTKSKAKNIIGIMVGIVLFIPFVLIAYTFVYFISAPVFGTVPDIVVGVLIVSGIFSVKFYEVISGNILLK